MRIALVADLHGNLPATQAVAAHILTQRIDSIYCLGDLVGKGPSSPETADWALTHCEVSLQGNWEEAIHGGLYCDIPYLVWYRRQLGDARLRTLSSLPFEHRFTIAGHTIRLLHGRPLVDDVIYSDSPLALRQQLFDTPDGYEANVVGFADIHRPFFQRINRGILFNTGSVGNPLGGQTDASYVIIEGEMGDTYGPLSFSFMLVPYDREEAVRHAEQSDGMPLKEAYIAEVRTGIYSR